MESRVSHHHSRSTLTTSRIKQHSARLLTLACLLLAVFSVQAHTPPSPPPSILVLGDSLSAGYGIDEQQGWVQLLRNRLQEQGRDWQVINASVSGETSAGGNRRLPKLLNLYQPQLVILELGGNDGLRGYPINTMQAQLQQAIDHSQAQGAYVLLLGIQIPPNYGKRYARMFSNSYTQLASANTLTLVPFFLDSVATQPTLMQADGIHPTSAGQPLLLDNIWPQLQDILKRLETKP